MPIDLSESQRRRIEARASLIAAGELPAPDMAKTLELARELGVTPEVARAIPDDLLLDLRAEQIAATPGWAELAAKGEAEAAMVRDNVDWAAKAKEGIDRLNDTDDESWLDGLGEGFKNLGKSFYNGVLDVARWNEQFALGAVENLASRGDEVFQSYDLYLAGLGFDPLGGGTDTITREEGGGGGDSDAESGQADAIAPEDGGKAAPVNGKEGGGGADSVNREEAVGAAINREKMAEREEKERRAWEDMADWLRREIAVNKSMQYEVKTDNAVSQFANDVMRNIPQLATNVLMMFGPGAPAAAYRMGAWAFPAFMRGAFTGGGAAFARAGGGVLPRSAAALWGGTKGGAAAFGKGAATGFAEGMSWGARSRLAPVMGAGEMYAQIAGGSYESLRERGVAPGDAFVGATIDAMGQTPLEYVAARAVTNLFRGASTSVWKAIGVGASAEGVTEFLQKWPEYIGHTWALTSKDSDDLYERAQAFTRNLMDADRFLGAVREGIYEGALGAVTGGIFSGAGHGMNGLNRIWRGAETDAQIEAEELTRRCLTRSRFQKVMEEAMAAREGRADAETARRMLEPIIPENFRQAWLRPEDLGALLQENSAKPQVLLDALGLDADAVNEAIETGAPVPVETARALAYGENLGVRDRLLAEPDGATLEEARNFDVVGFLREQTNILFDQGNNSQAGASTTQGQAPAQANPGGQGGQGGQGAGQNNAAANAATTFSRERDARARLEIRLTRVKNELRAINVSEPEIAELTDFMRQRALAAYYTYGLDPGFIIDERMNFLKGEDMAPAIARANAAAASRDGDSIWDQQTGETVAEWHARLNALVTYLPNETDAELNARLARWLPADHPYFTDPALAMNVPDVTQGRHERKEEWHDRLNALTAPFPGETADRFEARLNAIIPADHEYWLTSGRTPPPNTSLPSWFGGAPANPASPPPPNVAPPFQGSPDRVAKPLAGRVRGVVEIGGWKARIGLFRGRTPATALHEVAHTWIDDLIRLCRDDGSIALATFERRLTQDYARDIPGVAQQIRDRWETQKAYGRLPLETLRAFRTELKKAIDDWTLQKEQATAARKIAQKNNTFANLNMNPEYARNARLELDLENLIHAGERARRQAGEGENRILALDQARDDARALGAKAGLTTAEMDDVLARDHDQTLVGKTDNPYAKLQEFAVREFLDYVIEGRAPARGLSGVFLRFKKWLKRLYVGSTVDPRLREVFDRMLASPLQIQEKFYLDHIGRLERDFLNNPGLRSRDQKSLRELVDKAISEAESLLNMRDAAKRAKRRAALVKKFAREIAKEPIWRIAAASFNSSALEKLIGAAAVAELRAVGINIVDTPVKKSPDTLRLEVGGPWATSEEMLEELRLRTVARGERVETLASLRAEEQLGEEDRQAAVLINARFAEAFNDYLGKLDEIAWMDYFLAHNGGDVTRARKQAQALARRSSTIEGFAREKIEAMTFGEMNPARWRTALDRALRERARAVLDSDKGELLKAIGKARLNAAMIKEAEAALATRENLKRLAQRIASSKQGRYGEDYGYALRAIFLALGLANPRWAPDSLRAGKTVGDIVKARVDPEDLLGVAPNFSDWLMEMSLDPMTDNPRVSYNLSSLTPEHAREAVNLLTYLSGEGIEDRKSQMAAEKKMIEDLVARAVAAMMPLAEEPTRPRGSLAGDFRQGAGRFWAALDALRWQMKKADGLVNILGDKKGLPGPMETFFNREIIGAEARMRERVKKLQELLLPHIQTLSKMVERLAKTHGKALRDSRGDIIPAPTEIARVYGVEGFTPDMLVAIALNCGNESNLKRLVFGYPVSRKAVNPDGTESKDDDPNYRGLNYEVMAELVGDENAIRAYGKQKNPPPYHRDGLLTEEEWLACQGVWDALQSQWTDTKTAHRAIYGYEPQAIEVTPFFLNVRGKQIVLPGGYYPAAYDGDISERVRNWNDQEQLIAANDSLFNRPFAPKDHTMSRITGNPRLPMLLNSSTILKHISEVVTFIEMARPARALDRITRDPHFKAEYCRVYGKQDYDAIRPNLTGLVRKEPPPAKSNFLVDWANITRPYLVAWGLSWNLNVAALQATAIFTGMGDVGVVPVMRSIVNVALHPSLLKEVFKISPYMRSRLERIDQDLQVGVRQISPKPVRTVNIGGRDYTWEDLVDFGLKPIVWVDAICSGSVWLAAYNKRLMELHNDPSLSPYVRQAGSRFDYDSQFHKEASEYAEAIVKQGNPDYDASSRSAFLRANDANRLINSFASAIVLYAQRSRFMAVARKKGRATRLQKARVNFFDFMIAGLAMGLFRALCQSVSPEDDPKTFWSLVFATIAENYAMKFPVIGSFASEAILAITGAKDNFWRQGGWRTTLDAPLQLGQSIVKAGRALIDGKDEAGEKLAWAVADLISFFARVPFSKVARRTLKAVEQNEEKGFNPLAIISPDPNAGKNEPGKLGGLFGQIFGD